MQNSNEFWSRLRNSDASRESEALAHSNYYETISIWLIRNYINSTDLPTAVFPYVTANRRR